MGSLEPFVGARFGKRSVTAVERSRNDLRRSLRLAGRWNNILLFPVIVIELHDDDFLLALPQRSKTVGSGRFLKDILVGLLALACATWGLALVPARLNLIASVLKHALQLNLFCLLAVDVILELLDHTVSVLQRVLQCFRFELAVAGSCLAWRGWRRMFWGQSISFVHVVIRRSFVRRHMVITPHPVCYSLCKLLVLRREIFDFSLQSIPLRLSHGHIPSQTRQLRLVLLDFVDVLIVELCIHALELLKLSLQSRFL